VSEVCASVCSWREKEREFKKRVERTLFGIQNTESLCQELTVDVRTGIVFFVDAALLYGLYGPQASNETKYLWSFHDSLFDFFFFFD